MNKLVRNNGQIVIINSFWNHTLLETIPNILKTWKICLKQIADNGFQQKLKIIQQIERQNTIYKIVARVILFKNIV